MNKKVEGYFEMLHPKSELATLSDEEYKRALGDKILIRENLDKIELMYNNGIGNGVEPLSAIKCVINLIKFSKYRDILFLEEMDFVQEENFSKKQQRAYDRRQKKLGKKIDFVRKHIEEIDKHYQECMQGSKRNKIRRDDRTTNTSRSNR